MLTRPNYYSAKNILSEKYITHLTQQEITIETFGNHIDKSSFYFEIYFPIHITKWWEAINTLSIDYEREYSGNTSYKETFALKNLYFSLVNAFLSIK